MSTSRRRCLSAWGHSRHAPSFGAPVINRRRRANGHPRVFSGARDVPRHARGRPFPQRCRHRPVVSHDLPGLLGTAPRGVAAQPGEDDRGFRWSDRLRPSPQLLYHMLLAPARLPTASIRSQERHLPRLHHQPRPPPPASRLAPPRRTAQNVENSTLNTRRIAKRR